MHIVTIVRNSVTKWTRKVSVDLLFNSNFMTAIAHIFWNHKCLPKGDCCNLLCSSRIIIPIGISYSVLDLIPSMAVWLHGFLGEQSAIVPFRYQRDWHTIFTVFTAFSFVLESPQLTLRL